MEQILNKSKKNGKMELREKNKERERLMLS